MQPLTLTQSPERWEEGETLLHPRPVTGEKGEKQLLWKEILKGKMGRPVVGGHHEILERRDRHHYRCRVTS
jgi:hypothetical protein